MPRPNDWWNYVLSLFTIFNGLTFSQWLALGGFILGVLTFLVTWYYKDKHYRLELLKLEQKFKDE